MNISQMKQFVDEVCDYLDPEGKYLRPRVYIAFFQAHGYYIPDTNEVVINIWVPDTEGVEHTLVHECMHWFQVHSGILFAIPAHQNMSDRHVYFWNSDRWWGEVYEEYPWEIEAEAFAHEYMRSRLITKEAA